MAETFAVGTTLSTSVRVWIKNFVPFVFITTLLYAPLIIWGVVAVSGEPGREQLQNVASFARASALLVPLLNIFVSAALTYGVVMELQGKRASIGACVATGIARFFPIVGVALLSALVVGGGMLLLIVPGIIALCMLYVATPVAVIEKPGVMASLKRSRELTAGNKGAIFGLIFLVGIIAFAFTKIVEQIMVPNAADPAYLDQTMHAMRGYIYVDLVRAIIIGSFGSVVAGVAYYYLRNSKEGTSAQELAAVFE